MIRRYQAALLFVLAVAPAGCAAEVQPAGPIAPLPFALNPQAAHHCAVTAMGKGTWALAGTGEDPHVWSHPTDKATVAIARDYEAVSFEYRAAGGVAGIQVMLELQGRKVVGSRYMKLAPAAGWTRAYCIFKIDLKELDASAPSGIARVRLDLPERGNSEMHVRDLRLQGMDDAISSRIKAARTP